MQLVHPVPLEDADDWLGALTTTLLFGSRYDESFPRRVARLARTWEPDRVWAHRDHGRIVATLATEARMVTVPGGGGQTRDIAADALTAVSVAATHRRQGLLTTMIGGSLQAAKDRGDPIAVLIAAEWPIYGRFGYAPATFAADYQYFPRRPRAALPIGPRGAIRSVEPDEVAKVAPGVFAAARRLIPGQVDRPGPWWERRLGLAGFDLLDQQPNWVLHEGADGPDGLLGWRVTRDFELDGRLGTLEVSDFVAASDEAYRDLWAYLGSIDAVEQISLRERPVDEPVRWRLGDGRALSKTVETDFLWVRLLDVPAALAGRGYSMAGRLVLDVVDEALGGYAGGRVLLETDGPSARCAPTDEAPHLRISARALAAAYLGGQHLGSAGAGGAIEEFVPGALHQAELMFAAPRPPWNQTMF